MSTRAGRREQRRRKRETSSGQRFSKSPRAERCERRSRLRESPCEVPGLPPKQSEATQDRAAGRHFRARLRSVGVSEKLQQSSPKQPEAEEQSRDVAPRQLIEQFETAFAVHPNSPPTTRVRTPDSEESETQTEAENELLKPLADAFVQAGCTLYSRTVDKLTEAHNSVAKQIDEYDRDASSILDAHDELYSNIEWPLSRTQCSSKTHSTATVEVHLAKLAKDVASAETRIQALAQE